MTHKNKGSQSKTWRATCTICKALGDSLETFFTLLLAGIVFCLFYLTTLEELPCPNFVLRQLESGLQTQGVSLSMKELRFHPDGRIRIEAPLIYSTDLQSPLGNADSIMVKISLPLLLFGKVQVEQISVSNGTLLTPPMLSPSGTEEKLAHEINLQLERAQKTWDIKYARLHYANLKVYAHGEIGSHLLKPKKNNPKPDTPSIQKIFLHTLPKLVKSHKYPQMANAPVAVAHFYLNAPLDQAVTLQINANTIKPHPKTSVDKARILITASETDGVSLDAHLTGINTPYDLHIDQLTLNTHWDTLPKIDQWHPNSLVLNTSSIKKDALTIAPSILALATRDATNIATAKIDLGLGDRTLHLNATADLDSQTATLNLSGLIGKNLPRYANLFSPIDLARFAQFDTPPYFDLNAHFNSFTQLPTITARFETDFLESHGALFQRSKGIASINGPQINVNDIWILSGTHSGNVDIAFNTKTKKRRFLIEGNFDPNNLNLWFASWWKDFWANFQFPSQGAYTLLDSQSIYLQPSSIRVTGIGQGKNFGIRGFEMKDIWLKFNIYSHQFDLYDMKVVREEGQINGDTRIETTRDPADAKDKLTAIWVDATSSIDLSIAPELLHEIRQPTAEILAPYQYQTTPTVIAKSSSIMENGIFNNNIDLRIQTDSPLTVFHFPFQHVHSDVHIDNDIITIDNGLGGVGDGTLELNAEIIDDVITLDTNLKDANFGKTLYATSLYFEASEQAEIENAIANGTPLPKIEDEDEDFDINELLDYDGVLQTTFSGKGIVGDSLSFEGEGTFQIRDANLKKLRMFGLLSGLLEKTPLAFTTLKFTKADGTFIAKKKFIEFPSPTISGPLALIKSKGRYDLENDDLDFRAKLFPFRKSKMPITAIMGLALEPFSHALEVKLTGPFKDPKWSLFKQSNNDEDTSTSSSPTKVGPQSKR